jgi:hypothetical protein
MRKKMKKYILLLVMLMLTFPLQAAHKNKKQYIQNDELFLFNHGMYLAYPGKLYRIQSLYYSRSKGYFTYRSKMKYIPLNKMAGKNWDGRHAINDDKSSD